MPNDGFQSILTFPVCFLIFASREAVNLKKDGNPTKLDVLESGKYPGWMIKN
jgi:hypothetical protein